MTATIVVKRHTRPDQLAAETIADLCDQDVAWTVPKRHRSIAIAAAEAVTAADPTCEVAALHGAPGELLMMWSTAERGFQGAVFTYWPPAKGPEDIYRLVEQDDGTIVGVLVRQDADHG